MPNYAHTFEAYGLPPLWLYESHNSRFLHVECNPSSRFIGQVISMLRVCLHVQTNFDIS